MINKDRKLNARKSQIKTELGGVKPLKFTRAVTKSKDKHNARTQQAPAEKIQKALARIGFGSRREIERWILAGRINVNGKLAKLGDRISINDKVKIDGKLIQASRAPQETRILMYHKPAGEVCTRSDPEGRPTVFSANAKLRTKRWIMIGRLDFNTSGLLLFTNNGELANQLMHPSHEVEREYAVRVIGEVTPEMIKQLTHGVSLEDGLARFDSVEDAGGSGKNHWYHVILKEGRYREVRRLWESQNVTVSRLIRIRYGNITLPRYLRLGKLKELSEKEVAGLLQSVNR